MEEGVSEKTQLKSNQISRGRAKFALVVISVSNLFAWCCISLIAPFFPIEAARKGTTETIIGFIYSCPELVIFLASPVIGRLLSRNSPRFFYIAGLCVFGTCDILFGWLNQAPSGTPFIAICFAVRIVEGLGTASIMTSSMAIAGNNFPDRIGTVYGILETVTGSGFMIGPAIGGALYEVGGFGLPFWILGGCVFIAGCVSCAVLPSQDCVVESDAPSYTTLLRSPLVWFGIYCNFTGLMGFTIWEAIFAQHLQQFDLSQGVIGLIFVIPAAAYCFTTPFWGWLLDKNVPPIPLITSGLTCTAISLLLLGPAPFFTSLQPMLWLSILALALTGLAISPLLVSSIKCIVEGARDLGFKDDTNMFGLVGGVVQSSVCLGTFLGPLLGGAMTESYGFGWTMVFGAGLMIAPMIIFCPFLSLITYRKCKDSQKGDYVVLRGENGYVQPKNKHEAYTETSQ